MKTAPASVSMSGRLRRTKNDVIYVAVRVALAAARCLPYRVALILGGVLGAIACLLARGARRMALINVGRVFPQVPARERRMMVRRTFVRLGALLGDTIELFDLRTRADDRLEFSLAARAVLEEARAGGRGVVLVTAHHGAWERLAACLVEAGFPLTTPVRVSYDARLEEHVHQRLRRGRGVRAVDRDAPSTPRALVRALRAGGVAGFLIDIDTRVASVEVDFLGHSAATPVAPARLALRSGAAVVAASAARGRIRIERLRGAAAPSVGDIDDAARSLIATMARAVGDAILEAPDEWIWMHDRWRTDARPSALAPSSRAFSTGYRLTAGRRT